MRMMSLIPLNPKKEFVARAVLEFVGVDDIRECEPQILKKGWLYFKAKGELWHPVYYLKKKKNYSTKRSIMMIEYIEGLYKNG